MNEPDTELTGDPNGVPHREIDPKTGQQRAYVVLTAEERAKGFVEPVRRSYIHVGPARPGLGRGMRELTEEEKVRYEAYGYAMFEPYQDEGSVVGKYWTQAELDRIGGCNGQTTISQSIAETFARDPKFYGGTFCAACKEHFPLDEFVWEGTEQKLGTRSQQ